MVVNLKTKINFEKILSFLIVEINLNDILENFRKLVNSINRIDPLDYFVQILKH